MYRNQTSVPSLWLGFSFVSSLLHPGLVRLCVGFEHFPKFKRMLSVSYKIHAGINAFRQIGEILLYTRTPPYHDMCQVCEYLDSTISKVLELSDLKYKWFGEISLCIPGLYHTMTRVKSANAWTLAFPRSGKFNCAYLDSTISWQGIKSVNTQSPPFPRYWLY